MTSNQLVKEKEKTTFLELLKTKSKKKVKKVWIKLKKKRKGNNNSSTNRSKSKRRANEAKPTTTTNEITVTNNIIKDNSAVDISDDQQQMVFNDSNDSPSPTTIQMKDESFDNQSQDDSIPEPPPVATPSPNNIAKQKIMNKFLNLNSSAFKRLQIIDDVIHNNDKEEYHEELCEQISLIMKDWDGMKNVYYKESRKRKSRLNKDDLQTQHAMLVQLRERILLINDESTTHIPNKLDIDDCYNCNTPGTPTTMNTMITKETLRAEEECKPLELYFDDEWWAQYQDNTNATEKENMVLNAIQDKHDESNNKLQKVDDLLTSMKAIAIAQGDEVNRHKESFSSIERKSESMNDKLGYVNRKANETSNRV